MTEPPDPSSSRFGAVVLAAGQGTRMHSQLPKVLHPVAGQPMVLHVLDTLSAVGAGEVVLVVSHGADAVRAVVGDRARYAEQTQQLGTGHAVQQAIPHVPPAVERVLILYGDTPFLTAETLRSLIQAHADASESPQPAGGQGERPGEGSRQAPPRIGRLEEPGSPALTLLTMDVPDPTGYGRVVRDAAGRVLRLVEERDATLEQRAIREVNVGAYVVDARWLRDTLPKLQRSPGGEYYLTDLVGLAAADGRPVVAVRLDDPIEGLGVNDRRNLAQAERVMRDRVRERLLDGGVTLIDPETVYVDATVTVGPDTVLHPHTFLRGRTVIGANCEIGPSTQIDDSAVGDDCRVGWSVLEGATLAEAVQVGPFAHLRPGARLGRGVQIGNYAEVKNSVVHENVQQHHFSYVGDAEVGRDTNVGAGTITCNFDGANKHRTLIGQRVFLGSDTLLVAPVQIGDDSATGSGAVVTRSVPPGKLAVGVPARVLRDWEVPTPVRDNSAEKPAKSPEAIMHEMARLGLDVPPELLRAGEPDPQEPATLSESEDA